VRTAFFLIENYGQAHIRIEAPDPIDAIKFTMYQIGLKHKDIDPVFGGKIRLSEVLKFFVFTVRNA
jgi:HTH-type transcriptional regulator / antitoxin HigA